MLYSINLYRPLPISSLPLSGSPSLGLLETPQVSYLVIIPIHQQEHGEKGAGLYEQLIAGHMDQQKANEQQVRLQLCSPSSRHPYSLSRDQTCPSSSSPASGVFSQNLSGIREDPECQHHGSVLNIITMAVKPVNITQNRRECGRAGGGTWVPSETLSAELGLGQAWRV